MNRIIGQKPPSDQGGNRHSLLRMGNLQMIQERDRFVARLLARQGYATLEELRAFEAGCSGGYNLRELVQLGAQPSNLAGIDIDPNAVAYCREHGAGIRVHEGTAAAIPESDESFDVSLAFTLYSSIHDEEVAHAISHELFRITRPGGLILIYDMIRRNPRNPAVHPVGVDDVRRWFPKCPIRARSITLAPPLARPIGDRAPWAYGPLSGIPWLRTHAIYVLRRPAMAPGG
ncbi:MAG: methyltransferase domain-containing protein [Chloroflexi bacterium]|nr:methyltransferase domain-containing protein [Chloroflexota bacterium]